MAIDVGHACADLPHSGSINYTYLANENPANASGTINYICCYGSGNASYQFGSMTLTGGTTYDTNGESGALSVVSGLNEFSGGGVDFNDFAITSGDFVGVYVPSSGVKTRNYGSPTGSGQKRVYGDQIGSDGVNFGADLNAYDIAVRFTGVESGGATRPLPQRVLSGPFSGPLNGVF